MLETIVATATILQAYRVVTQPPKVPLSTGTTLRPDTAMLAQLIVR